MDFVIRRHWTTWWCFLYFCRRLDGSHWSPTVLTLFMPCWNSASIAWAGHSRNRLRRSSRQSPQVVGIKSQCWELLHVQNRQSQICSFGDNFLCNLYLRVRVSRVRHALAKLEMWYTWSVFKNPVTPAAFVVILIIYCDPGLVTLPCYFTAKPSLVKSDFSYESGLILHSVWKSILL